MLDRLSNDREVIGGNKPPGVIDSAKEAMTELSAFLADTPVIENQPQAKQGGAHIERTRISLAAMEDERSERVGPLNKELTAINGAYRVVREPLEKVLKELRRRLTDFANAIEAARIAEANRLAAERAEAERIAREAEVAEQNAIAMADVGELTDAGGAIAEADARFRNFERAYRAAAVAAKNVPVRIGSAMGGRALSMRTVEVLVIDDACAAIKAIGLTDKVQDAILSSAREFRKAYGELPMGISSTHQRSM
jgi:hypothetical protein